MQVRLAAVTDAAEAVAAHWAQQLRVAQEAAERDKVDAVEKAVHSTCLAMRAEWEEAKGTVAGDEPLQPMLATSMAWHGAGVGGGIGGGIGGGMGNGMGIDGRAAGRRTTVGAEIRSCIHASRRCSATLLCTFGHSVALISVALISACAHGVICCLRGGGDACFCASRSCARCLDACLGASSASIGASSLSANQLSQQLASIWGPASSAGMDSAQFIRIPQHAVPSDLEAGSPRPVITTGAADEQMLLPALAQEPSME